MEETLSYTWMESPVGRLLLAGDDSGLHYLLFENGRNTAAPQPGWREDAGRFSEEVRQLRAYFKGELQEFDLKLAPAGTPFQQRVWAALRTIPYGETLSYGELARRVESPTASRAVGLANGANPISIIVPCHRVIGSNGKLTGYGGGLERKEFLLGLERKQLRL